MYGSLDITPPYSWYYPLLRVKAKLHDGLPDTDYTLFAPYFGATAESDVTKSYSVDNFVKGIFYGGVVNKTLKPNYILISKNS